MKPFNLEEYLKNPKRKIVTEDGRKIPGTALEFENDINWDKVLIQAAISAIPANISHSAESAYGQDPVYLSIEDAKRMVEHLKEELKKGGKKNEHTGF